jgi:ppGpp synthetase/RelA/SpoT-type nucleotidyltranferase
VIFELLTADGSLSKLAHSVKYRIKDPEHLRDKLYRKCVKARKNREAFDITRDNLYREINDLIGLRILHLYTGEIVGIDAALQSCLSKENYLLLEGPLAKTWDDESRRFYDSVGIETEESETQYTSVHYVFDAQNDSQATFEIQVRTLAEELWGEVDHRINYPDRHPSLACTEQISVLARVTSSCTRLVDAIFRTHDDFHSQEG